MKKIATSCHRGVRFLDQVKKQSFCRRVLVSAEGGCCRWYNRIDDSVGQRSQSTSGRLPVKQLSSSLESKVETGGTLDNHSMLCLNTKKFNR